MFVSHKPNHFGNEYHTIEYAKYKVIYNVDIMEGKDRPIVMVKKDFDEKGVAAGLMISTTKKLWEKGKAVITDSGLYILGVLISMVKKGVFGSVLIKKRRYWPKGAPEEEIIWHMQNKEVGDVDAVQGSIRGNSYHIMAIEDPN